MKSCERQTYPSATLSCSNHGICHENNCICDLGFSSLGDFALTEYYDCDQELKVFEVLSMIGLISSLSMTMFSARILYLKQLKYQSLLNPLVLFPFCHLLEMIFNDIYFILKVFDPLKFLVGKSIIITIAAGLHCFSPLFILP